MKRRGIRSRPRRLSGIAHLAFLAGQYRANAIHWVWIAEREFDPTLCACYLGFARVGWRSYLQMIKRIARLQEAAA